jgi:hypothetical protein
MRVLPPPCGEGWGGAFLTEAAVSVANVPLATAISPTREETDGGALAEHD